MYQHLYFFVFIVWIFLPELAIAFEYNGEYHYFAIRIFDERKLKAVQHRDRAKKLICETAGINLLVIPYWWNNTIESVAHLIHMIRPDIPIDQKFIRNDPIPVEIPRKYQGNSVEVLT